MILQERAREIGRARNLPREETVKDQRLGSRLRFRTTLTAQARKSFIEYDFRKKLKMFIII